MIQQTTMPITARVTAVHRERYEVAAGGQTLFARLKTGAYRDADTVDFPTVGDRVDLLVNEAGDSQIVGTQPRSTYFYRKMAFTTANLQAVAANFDEVFILVSLNYDFNPRRIERYATQAWQSGGTPVLVLTKLDLVEDAAEQIFEAQEAAPGVEVHAVSAVSGEGLEELRARLTPGKTIVLLGSSGVGKSSLVNALAGEMLMDIGGIREDDSKGRHTTTHRQMIHLQGGVDIIDTPGMRELGLWDAEEGMHGAFEDIDELAQACRFSDCAHKAEPGCAVKRAVEEGRLDAARLKNYHRLQREAARRKKVEAIKKGK